MKIVVERAEQHDDQSDDQSGFKQRKCRSKQLVDPSQHDEADDALKEFSEESEQEEHSDHDDRKCYDLEDVLRSLDILADPLADH